MSNISQRSDDLGGAELLSQPPDGQGGWESALAARLQRPQPGMLGIAQGADSADGADASVWIFDALTGRSATAVERLKLVMQIARRQSPR